MIEGTVIEKVKKTNSADALFSVLIPSWNNLKFLKLCVESIRKNSSFSHQIIVHINEGNDGTLQWVKQQPDIDYVHSDKNIGICYALNGCRSLIQTKFVVFLNDDMYVCPKWDIFLKEEIDTIGHPYFFLSATAIEPVFSSNCAIQKDYGNSTENFNETKLLDEFESLSILDWYGATWPPNVVHVDIWDMVGGYSVEFFTGYVLRP